MIAWRRLRRSVPIAFRRSSNGRTRGSSNDGNPQCDPTGAATEWRSPGERSASDDAHHGGRRWPRIKAQPVDREPCRPDDWLEEPIVAERRVRCQKVNPINGRLPSGVRRGIAPIRGGGSGSAGPAVAKSTSFPCPQPIAKDACVACPGPTTASPDAWCWCRSDAADLA